MHERLKEHLKEAEGYRRLVYDDATGLNLVIGSIVKGHPTVGVGHNLLIPMTGAAIDFLLDEDINRSFKDLYANLSWFKDLDDVRKRAMIELCFNLGLTKLMKFTVMLYHMEKGEYKRAAVALLDSLWAHQVAESRSTRLAYMIREGMDLRRV